MGLKALRHARPGVAHARQGLLSPGQLLPRGLVGAPPPLVVRHGRDLLGVSRRDAVLCLLAGLQSSFSHKLCIVFLQQGNRRDVVSTGGWGVHKRSWPARPCVRLPSIEAPPPHPPLSQRAGPGMPPPPGPTLGWQGMALPGGWPGTPAFRCPAVAAQISAPPAAGGWRDLVPGAVGPRRMPRGSELPAAAAGTAGAWPGVAWHVAGPACQVAASPPGVLAGTCCKRLQRALLLSSVASWLLAAHTHTVPPSRVQLKGGIQSAVGGLPPTSDALRQALKEITVSIGPGHGCSASVLGGERRYRSRQRVLRWEWQPGSSAVF